MRILITDFAENKLEQIIDYLTNEFGILSSINFLDEVKRCLELISNDYTIGIKIKPNYYSLVIVKQITAYYKIDNGTIMILTFFDNRQNPNKLDEFLS
jgi:plasmid stabilization system protein ParE